MIIRPEQATSLSANSRTHFEERLVEHIRTHFPEKVWKMEAPDLRRRIAAAVDRALVWQFEWEDEVAWFVGYTFELGEEFDTAPEYAWVAPILEDRTKSGWQKIDAIEDGLSDD